MIKANYTQCEYDSCVYFKQCNDDFTYLLLYVNDMLIVMRNKIHIHKLKAQLKEEFDMKDLEEAKKILCIEEINRDRSTDKLWLSRENYVLRVLERFIMTKVRSVTTPLTCHFRLSSSENQNSQEEKDKMSRVIYVSGWDH